MGSHTFWLSGTKFYISSLTKSSFLKGMPLFEGVKWKNILCTSPVTFTLPPGQSSSSLLSYFHFSKCRFYTYRWYSQVFLVEVNFSRSKLTPLLFTTSSFSTISLTLVVTLRAQVHCFLLWLLNPVWGCFQGQKSSHHINRNKFPFCIPEALTLHLPWLKAYAGQICHQSLLF